MPLFLLGLGLLFELPVKAADSMLPVAQNTEKLALLPFEATVDMVTVAEAETRLLLLLLPTYSVVGGTCRPHGGTVVGGVRWIVWLKCRHTHFASRVDGVT